MLVSHQDPCVGRFFVKNVVGLQTLSFLNLPSLSPLSSLASFSPSMGNTKSSNVSPLPLPNPTDANAIAILIDTEVRNTLIEMFKTAIGNADHSDAVEHVNASIANMEVDPALPPPRAQTSSPPPPPLVKKSVARAIPKDASRKLVRPDTPHPSPADVVAHDPTAPAVFPKAAVSVIAPTPALPKSAVANAAKAILRRRAAKNAAAHSPERVVNYQKPPPSSLCVSAPVIDIVSDSDSDEDLPVQPRKRFIPQTAQDIAVGGMAPTHFAILQGLGSTRSSLIGQRDRLREYGRTDVVESELQRLSVMIDKVDERMVNHMCLADAETDNTDVFEPPVKTPRSAPSTPDPHPPGSPAYPDSPEAAPRSPISPRTMKKIRDVEGVIEHALKRLHNLQFPCERHRSAVQSLLSCALYERFHEVCADGRDPWYVQDIRDRYTKEENEWLTEFELAEHNDNCNIVQDLIDAAGCNSDLESDEGLGDADDEASESEAEEDALLASLQQTLNSEREWLNTANKDE